MTLCRRRKPSRSAAAILVVHAASPHQIAWAYFVVVPGESAKRRKRRVGVDEIFRDCRVRQGAPQHDGAAIGPVAGKHHYRQASIGCRANGSTRFMRGAFLALRQESANPKNELLLVFVGSLFERGHIPRMLSSRMRRLQGGQVQCREGQQQAKGQVISGNGRVHLQTVDRSSALSSRSDITVP